MINPGAVSRESYFLCFIHNGRTRTNIQLILLQPGFCYTFSATREGLGKDKNWQRPLIGLSGDCAESAYILRPIDGASSLRGVMEDVVDRSTKYALMSEIKCGSTVGSLAIGYDDLLSSKGTTASQHNGYAKIYVPCFEQDKVLVFAMGSSENEHEKSFE